MADREWSNPIPYAFLVRTRSHSFEATLLGRTEPHFPEASDQRERPSVPQHPGRSIPHARTYVITKLHRQSNFLLSLLRVPFYKKKLRNKTQLKKEHAALGYWPGILQKSNPQSILGPCAAHVAMESTAWVCRPRWKVPDNGHWVLQWPGSAFPHILAGHFLIVMSAACVRPPHVTGC